MTRRGSSAGSVSEAADATLEAWARAYVEATAIEHKLDPGKAPARSARETSAVRLERPGRPPGLRVVPRSPATPRPGALARPEARARLLHTFLHHEVQAAELMAWALLAFPDAPLPVKRGLGALLEDEARHARLYAVHLERLGCAYGDHPVRDWFWERVPSCPDLLSFLAVMGLGLEAHNLEHTRDFAAQLSAAGDEEAAAIVRRVGEEERAHVAFGARWFAELCGDLDFDRWARALPAPLTPLIFQPKRIDREARRRAGLPDAFLDRLEAWRPAPSA